MLVLSRVEGERIKVGEGLHAVWVTVVGVTSTGRVRLGFEAAPATAIDREELLDDGEGYRHRHAEWAAREASSFHYNAPEAK